MIGRQIAATDRQIDRLRRPDDDPVDPVYVIADIAGMEYLEGFEITLYFEDRVLGDPVRERLVPYIPRTVNDFEHMEVQRDGRIRHWRYVPELGHHLLVITTADGALFNAFDDSNFTRKQRRER